MGACAKNNIALTFMSSHGRFMARVTGEVRGNVTLRKEQFRISDNEARSKQIAQNFILGKVYNSKWVLELAIRDYPLRFDEEALKCKVNFR